MKMGNPNGWLEVMDLEPEEYDGFRQQKWLAVYGAYLALQAFEYAKRGEGIPSEVMEGFKEEARTVAELECEGDVP